MKSILFIGIVLFAGCTAGVIHGLANLAIVEPYLDKAISIENQNLFAAGQEQETPGFWVEFNSYRDWQKGGQILAGAILGTSIGALFGIVFVYSKMALPTKNNVKKSIILAGMMWFTIFIIPFLKYPANPPTVGDPDTVVLRGILYLSFIAISGFGAVGFYQMYKRLEKGKKRLGALVGYAVFIGAIFLIMPSNPDEVTAPMDLVNGFRAMSVAAVSIYWIALGTIFGGLWQKFQPDRQIQKTTQ